MANVGTAAAGQVLQGSGNGSSPTFKSIGVNSGLTANGVLIAQGNNAFTATSSGDIGQVLTSNGVGVNPSFQTVSATIKVTTYTSSGSWTIDPRTVEVELYIWGGGGGGGSGRCGVSNVAGGGGGGGPCGFYYGKSLASSLTASPYPITIGAGGNGAALVNATTTNGNPGSPGGNTSIGTLFVVSGGTGGSGGINAPAAGGLGTGYNLFALSNVSGGSGGVTTGTAANPYVLRWAGGGAGAPGYTAGTPRPGLGGGDLIDSASNVLVVGGTAGSNTGGNGGNGNSPISSYLIIGGTGGGSGGHDGVVTAGSGGNGAFPGGGGGGGAGNLNLNNSGAGGDGAAGQVIIVEYF